MFQEILLNLLLVNKTFLTFRVNVIHSVGGEGGDNELHLKDIGEHILYQMKASVRLLLTVKNEFREPERRFIQSPSIKTQDVRLSLVQPSKR